MKKLVVLTGAGMSAESGFSTFRDSGGLWDRYPVEQVASHDGWLANPTLVNNFYNNMRHRLIEAKPNEGHLLLAKLQDSYDVRIVTQNVDNLHERAGSRHVLHLHGEAMKVCSSQNPDDERYIRELAADDCDVKPGELAADGSLLRPYIVFFQEAVPKFADAIREVAEADIFVVIGTSLVVYPAASLLECVPAGRPVYVIDPKEVKVPSGLHCTFIRKGASEGVAELCRLLRQDA